MEKETIRRLAYGRMEKIENIYCDQHVVGSVQQYYLLQSLIAEGMRAYMASHGLLPLHAGDCNDGREEMGWGPLSDFEKDCVAFLNATIEQQERDYDRRKVIEIPVSVRTIGLA